MSRGYDREDLDRDLDPDLVREAAIERRQRRWNSGCFCGYPDMSGTCPGPAFCPMHGETPPESP